jgi:hypothetical protein
MAIKQNPEPMPRWVKLFIAILAIAVTVVVLLALFGGHGPWQHTSAGGSIELSAGRLSSTSSG